MCTTATIKILTTIQTAAVDINVINGNLRRPKTKMYFYLAKRRVFSTSIFVYSDNRESAIKPRSQYSVIASDASG